MFLQPSLKVDVCKSVHDLETISEGFGAIEDLW